jgi:YVTN family beta-propeller protein
VLGGGSVITVNWRNGTLYVLDAATGAVQAQIGVGAVPDFTSPALIGGLALVPTRAGVVAISGI